MSDNRNIVGYYWIRTTIDDPELYWVYAGVYALRPGAFRTKGDEVVWQTTESVVVASWEDKKEAQELRALFESWVARGRSDLVDQITGVLESGWEEVWDVFRHNRVEQRPVEMRKKISECRCFRMGAPIYAGDEWPEDDPEDSPAFAIVVGGAAHD